MGRLATESLRIAIVGGGPGGLFAALLLKERMPQHEVVVFERNPPDATFGFGVVFSARTLGGFAAADSQLVESMAEAGVAWEDIEVRRHGGALRCGGHGFSAVSRRALLMLLQERARLVGVDLRFEHEAVPDDYIDADLVVACDGVNSALREMREEVFAPRIEHSTARYIWFATPQPFDALTFLFAENEHGHWGLHAYPFAPGTSTFIVETDDETWRRAGLDRQQDLPPGVSDMESLRYCEELFAEHLGGHRILENNSKWLRFGTLRCRRWRDGNLVLLGDAAHTAHFSVGSGTKMAMEDAIALATAIGEADEIDAALVSYESSRRPAIEAIQAAAAPSLFWWERFRLLADRSDEEFAFHFLTRSPTVTRQRLLARDWRFVRRVEDGLAAAAGGEVEEGPLAQPLSVGDLRLSGRLAVVPQRGIGEGGAAIGAALYGAGLVLIPSDGEAVAEAAWMAENTDAAVGILLADHDSVPADPGPFQLLAADASRSDLDEWPSGLPLLALALAPEDVAGTAADDLLARLEGLAAGRPLVVGVGPPGDSPEAAVSQLAFCDRVRQEALLPTALVDGFGGADGSATVVLAGRSELVLLAPSLASELWEPSGLLRRPLPTPAGSR